uniref:Uncharacterized protein n=1 Tax=Moschus moschiferus TaxID=68415 RepID=A0A8C6EAC2_MOSMO
MAVGESQSRSRSQLGSNWESVNCLAHDEAIMDFHHTFTDLNELVEKQTSVAYLLASFNDQSTLDHLVIYLRLLPSGDLQQNSKFLKHSIEGGARGQVGRQHLHPGSGPGAQVSIRVEGMDHGEGGTTPPEGSSPRSAFSAGLDTRIPSTNRPALPSARC